MKRRVLAMLLAGAMAMGAFATVAFAEEETEAAAAEALDIPEDAVFGIIVPDIGSEFYAGEVERLKSQMEAAGYDSSKLMVTSFGMDAAQQTTALENQRVAGVTVCDFWPAPIAAAEDAVKEAEANGMKVLTVAGYSEYASLNTDASQADSGYAIAESAAAYLSEQYGADSDIEVAMYRNPQNDSVLIRCAAMAERFAELMPNVTVYEYDQLSLDEAMSVPEAILQTHPDIKAIISYGDTGALGALEVFNAAGRDDIVVFGCDAMQQALDAIKNDPRYVSTTTFEQLDYFDLMVRLANGETFDEPIYMGVATITAENVDDYLAD